LQLIYVSLETEQAPRRQYIERGHVLRTCALLVSKSRTYISLIYHEADDPIAGGGVVSPRQMLQHKATSYLGVLKRRGKAAIYSNSLWCI
jgi:hypothetical protein